MKTRVIQDQPTRPDSPRAPAGPPRGVRGWMRGHRLVSFFALAYALSWWGWPLYETGVVPEPLFLPTGPLLAALIVIGVTEGRSGFRDLGARVVRWRVAWYWYAVAIGLPLAIRSAATGLNIALGAPVPDLTALAWGSFALAFAVRLVDPVNSPVGEEPGFRGYAVPRLQADRTPLRSAAILGILVSGWHFPLVMTGQLGAIGLLGTVAVTFVYVWLFNHTGGSVLLTLIFHAVEGSITFGDLGFTGADANRMELLYSGVLCLTAVAVVVLDRRAWATTPATEPIERPSIVLNVRT